MNHLQAAFDETHSYSRYHPSKGYWWEFKDSYQEEQRKKLKESKNKEEPSSKFQRDGVDVLLGELYKKFPPKFPPVPASTANVPITAPPVDAKAAESNNIGKVCKLHKIGQKNFC